MNFKLTLLVASIGLFSGCANQTPHETVSSAPIMLAVTQTGKGQNATHVFCEDGLCPARTQKVISVPPPAQKPLTTPVVQAPVKSETFKVHFRWSWAKLDESGEKELRSVVANIKDKQVKMIEVAGRTDPTGSRKYNEKLALRRAETIKTSLVKAGVSASIIKTSAQKPCCDGSLSSSPKVMQQLRRTDIEITITTK